MADLEQKQAFYKVLLEQKNNPAYFSGKNGIVITEIQEGYAKGEMPNTSGTQNTLGSLHGGALATLIDSTSGMAVVSLGYGCVTVHSTIEYLRIAAPGAVVCEARVRKAGKTITVCQATVTDSAGQEVAIGTFSFYITGALQIEEFLC